MAPLAAGRNREAAKLRGGLAWLCETPHSLPMENA